MNLLKRLFSVALSLPLFFGGVTYRCIEPSSASKSEQKTDSEPKSKTSVWSRTPVAAKRAIVALTINSVLLYACCYKYDNELRNARADINMANLAVIFGMHRYNYDRPQERRVSTNDDMKMYVLQLRLTNAMIAKVGHSDNVEARRNLDVCRKYLIAKLYECATPESHRSDESKNRLKQLEDRLDAIRHSIYSYDDNGNVVCGADIEEPREDLVECNISQTYYLPVDIQYCGDMRTDEDGNINVHGVSSYDIASWVSSNRPSNVCVVCQQASNYFVPHSD